MKARTIKEISGASIDTIPIGTEFEITHYSPPKDPSSRWDATYSSCSGIGITSIYNDEFELI